MTARVAHFEISGPNDLPLFGFYAGLLGWPTDDRGPGDSLLQPESGPAGSIIESPQSRMVLGVAVTDLHAVRAGVADPRRPGAHTGDGQQLGHQSSGQRARRQPAVPDPGRHCQCGGGDADCDPSIL